MLPFIPNWPALDVVGVRPFLMLCQNVIAVAAEI